MAADATLADLEPSPLRGAWVLLGLHGLLVRHSPTEPLLERV
jgi:hypothetical protein